MKSFDKIIVANWKMQLSVNEAKKLAKSIKSLIAHEHINTKTQVAVCPDFVDIAEVAKVFRGTKISLGAQDGFYEDKGQFTGEVSIKELKELGCEYLIIGHSERRKMGETDQVINKKIKAALLHTMVPILCIGETFEQRQEGSKGSVIIQQVHEALQAVELTPTDKIIIAYEPVWVIGSGQAISPDEAAQTASVIRQSYIDTMDGKYLENLSIIYGGSVTPDNVAQFSKLENIKGALVGGASLKSKSFVDIIKNA